MEVLDRETDRSAHSLHLVRAAFMKCQLDPTDPRAASNDPSLGGCRSAILELDTGSKRRERIGGRRADDVDVVHLGNPEARMRQSVGERAVIRQQERARRVGVEPTYRHHTRRVRDEIDDSRAPLRIVRSRDDPGRLVQEHVVKGLALHALPVYLDDIVEIDDRVELACLTVHGYPPFTNQLVGTPPRRDSCAREKHIQPHFTILVRLDG